jgi:hypothetical protein
VAAHTDHQEEQRDEKLKMGEPKLLDRDTIERAFRLMGQYLLDRKAVGEIAIYGGSAILLQFDWRKVSRDVDARVTSEGSHGLVIDAAASAATRLGLPRSWLSENVAMYARRGEGEADRIPLGLYPSPERFGLRVTAAKPSYILAMKLKALERVTIDDRDYKDVVNRSIECGVFSVDELREVFRKFFPDEDLPPRAALRFEELASDIRAKLR